jgi:hypothetical protein
MNYPTLATSHFSGSLITILGRMCLFFFLKSALEVRNMPYSVNSFRLTVFDLLQKVEIDIRMMWTNSTFKEEVKKVVRVSLHPFPDLSCN